MVLCVQTLCVQTNSMGLGCKRVDAAIGGFAPAPSAGKGAISQLQEFVQSARDFPMPPSCPVLQWNHDTRMMNSSLEFRATVSFVLDGVPHHSVGGWQSSKKLAQRDVAERALGLFVGQWGHYVDMDGHCGETQNQADADCKQRSLQIGPLQALERHCAEQFDSDLRWNHMSDSGLVQAFVEIAIFGIPHTFAGKRLETKEAAYEDVAKRALWYLQCPGYEDLFEPDMSCARATAEKIPAPAECWAKDDVASDEDQTLADRKTLLMYVQNRLQEVYGKHVAPGTSVWYWSYDRASNVNSWPPTFRAVAYIPLAGRTFIGEWTRGQREAQSQVCLQISEFLDTEFVCARSAGAIGGMPR